MVDLVGATRTRLEDSSASGGSVKTGYELWLELIDLARVIGDLDGAWQTLEILHLLELRRYEILAASDEKTVSALYSEIIGCFDSLTDPIKLSAEVRERFLSDPLLLMDAHEMAVLEGLLSKEHSKERN
jgi:hypothetical protein